MKKLTSTIFVLFLIYGTASGQRVEINQKSIAKKDKFRTKVELLDGSKHTGKFVGYTDTTIILSILESYEGGYFHRTQDFKYDEIETIKIKRRFTGLGIISGAPLCGFSGFVIGDFLGG